MMRICKPGLVLLAAVAVGGWRCGAAEALAPNVTKSVVIVVAHPGELAGCVGTAVQLRQKGYELHVVDLTNGADGEKPGVCVEEERRACAALGATAHFLGQAKGALFAEKQVCRELAEIFRAVKPTAVLTHWPIDTDIDRVVTAGATLKAVQNAGRDQSHHDTFIYYFETPGGTLNFKPLYHVYFNHVMEDCRKVIGCYDKAKYAEGDPAKLQSFREGTIIRSAADPTTLRALQCWPPPRRAEAFSAFDNYVYGDTYKGYYPLPIFTELSKREVTK